MRSFLAALQFLTILPVPFKTEPHEKALGSSTALFPIIGLLIGGIVAGLAVGLGYILPPILTAILLTITVEGISGCLHLDGLADSMDGLLSSCPRNQVLEIMRDSYNGTMGVFAIVSIMLVKVGVFGTLTADGLWKVALLMPLAGRCCLVLSMSFLPYARPEGGLATAFYRTRPRLTALLATGILLGTVWFTAELTGLIAAAVSLASVMLFAVWCSRRIGGATGDILGAACEISEAVFGVAFASAVFLGV